MTLIETETRHPSHGMDIQRAIRSSRLSPGHSGGQRGRPLTLASRLWEPASWPAALWPDMAITVIARLRSQPRAQLPLRLRGTRSGADGTFRGRLRLAAII